METEEPAAKRLKKDPSTSLKNIQACCVCPILAALFVDPVVAADGNAYERSGIVRWLKSHNTSPVSNQVLSSKLVFPSITLRQSVSEIVDSAAIGKDAAIAWHLESGKKKHTNELPGGEPAARSHFETAASLGSSEAKLVVTLLDSMATARAAQFDLSWMFKLAPDKKWALLPSFRRLEVGTVVKLIDNVTELERLCERPAAGADGAVGWCDDSTEEGTSMSTFAGCEAKVWPDDQASDEEVEDRAHSDENCALFLVLSGTETNDGCWFPFDAVMTKIS